MSLPLKKLVLIFFLTSLMFWGEVVGSAKALAEQDHLTYEDYPTIRLRSLDKITARTLTFDAQVGTIIKFGDIYIKIQACQKPPAVEKTESAAFLQIWEVDKVSQNSHWIFSGWMFASSPSLSGMDHPVYDVWVIDCLGKDPEQETPPVATDSGKPLPDEGEVKEGEAKEPVTAPEATLESDDPPVSDAPKPEPVPTEPTEATPSEQESGAPPSESFDGIY